MSRTEAASRPVPSGRSRDSTARWFLTNSKTSADMTGSSTSYPEVVNASVLTHFSASAPQSRGSDRAPGQRSYAELATESLSSSSSESLDSSSPRGERSSECPLHRTVPPPPPEGRGAGHGATPEAPLLSSFPGRSSSCIAPLFFWFICQELILPPALPTHRSPCPSVPCSPPHTPRPALITQLLEGPQALLFPPGLDIPQEQLSLPLV